jgi:preprotein translocase SecE subunit
VADNEDSKKRRIRTVSESFREQAEKAQAKADLPAKPKRVRGTFGKLLTPLAVIGLPLIWIAKHIIPPYLKNSWNELRLVTWPNRKQTRQLTFAVILFAIVFGALIASVDYGLDKVFKQVLLK